MSIAFVQQKAEQSTTSVASFTTSAMTVTAGNAIVSCTSNWSYIPATTTDSLSNLYAPVISEHRDIAVAMESAQNVAGGSVTFTVTPTASTFVSICVQEYSGMATFPVETSSHATNEPASTLIVPGDLSPTTPGDLYVSAWTHFGSSNESFTPGAGFTLRSNLTLTANQPLGTQDLIASGLQSCTATLGNSVYWVACAAAFKAADATTPAMAPNFIPSDFPMADRGFDVT